MRQRPTARGARETTETRARETTETRARETTETQEGCVTFEGSDGKRVLRFRDIRICATNSYRILATRDFQEFPGFSCSAFKLKYKNRLPNDPR